MRQLAPFLVLISACATQKAAQPPAVADARADGSFLFLSTAGVTAATDASLANAMTTMCDPGCDRVYVDIDEDPAADALHRVVRAASTVVPAPRVFLMPATKNAIELDLSDAACAVTVTVEDDGASVWRLGNPIAPDPACEVWNKSICRGENQHYDWPRLRSEVGNLDEICVAFRTTSAAQLISIHETLRQPIIRLVQADTKERGAAVDLAARVRNAGTQLQWCLDGEVAETEQVPMQVTLRVGVHTDGRVTRVEVIDGVRSTANFEACVADVAQKFVFDLQDSPQVVSVRLSVEPGGKGPLISAASEGR